jgi:hypothetical protein
LRFVEIGTVCRGASNFDRFGIGRAREHTAFLIEHVVVRRIKVSDQLSGDPNSRGDDKRPISAKGKGGKGDAPGFAASDGQHDADLAFIVSRRRSIVAQSVVGFALGGPD